MEVAEQPEIAKIARTAKKRGFYFHIYFRFLRFLMLGEGFRQSHRDSSMAAIKALAWPANARIDSI